MNKPYQLAHQRIVYSGWDFQQAISALTFLVEECDFDKKYSEVELRRFRCFETTVIVSFSRPFKVGRGRSNFDISSIGVQFSEDEKKLKDKLLHLRDKVVSHSDEEAMEYKTYSFTVFDDSELRMPVALFQEGLFLCKNEYLEIEKLLCKLIHAVAEYNFRFAQENPELFEHLKTAKAPVEKKST